MYIPPPDVIEDFALAPSNAVVIRATTNDLVPSSDTPASLIVLNVQAAVSLTGMVPSGQWCLRRLINTGAASLTIANESVLSVAANRFSSTSDITLAVGQQIAMLYHPILLRWIPLGPPYGVTASGGGGSSAGRLIGVQTLTGSGTYTPTAGTAAIFVRGVAPGGGSGGAAASFGGAVSGGASSGGMAEIYISSVAVNYAYNCGIPGAAGAAGSNPGGNATSATFGSVLTIPGGLGSSGSNSGAGAASPAIPTGGNVNLRGQPGFSSVINYVTGEALNTGAGANGYFGAGGIGVDFFNFAPAPGTPGLGFGAGAGGAVSSDSFGPQAGAAGAPGIFRVWEYS